jgi:outer membrane protein assembly factor BamD
MLKQVQIIPVALLALMLAGCGAFGEKPDVTRGWPVQQLYYEAKAAMDSGDYETAIDYYEKLESRFPFGRFAQQAQIDVAYAYWKYEEYASAIAAADRFIKLHPRHPHVDYAYYLKGMVNFEQGKSFMDRFLVKDRSQRDPGAVIDAFNDFSVLVERFPRSKYSQDALQRMLYLKNLLAQHEVHVADYYMRRGAYVAASNRSRYVIENYQGAPAIPDALTIMAKAYKFMDLDDLSDDALRVLKLNYPDFPGIAEVESIQK